MGIVARQSIFSTVLLYLGAIIGYINLLYFFPRFLTTSEIGTVRTIQDIAALFVPIAQFGLSHSLIRYFPKFGLTRENRGGFLTLILLFGILGYLIFFALIQLFNDSILSYFAAEAPEIMEYFPIALGVTFLLLVYNLLTAYCQSLLNIVAPNFIKDVVFRVAITAILLSYFTGWVDFNGLMFLLLAAYGIMTLGILMFLAGQRELMFSFNFKFLSGAQTYQLLTYAVFSLLGASGMLIIGKIDSIMVTGMLGTSLNGIYTTVFYIAVVIELPKRAINQISLPLVSRSFEKNDMAEIGKLYRQTSINQLLVGSLLLVGIWINLDSIFLLMPKGDEFAVGKWVVIIIGLGRIFDMASGINSEIIVMSKHYKFNMVLLSLLAAFTIILNLWLIPKYGIIGAAIGSAVALVLFNFSKFIFIWWKLGIQPFKVNTLMVILIGAASLVTALYLPRIETVLLDILMRSVVAVIIFALGVIVFRPSEEIADLIKRFKF